MGKLLGIVAGKGPAVDVALVADDDIKLLEELAVFCLPFLEPFGRVFAEKQLQDGLEIVVDLALLAGGVAELLLAEQVDDLLEIGFDAAIAAFLERLFDQRGAVGIGWDE